MDLTTFNTTIDEFTSSVRKLEEDLKVRASNLFKEAVKELFVFLPDVKAVTWTQYTPYFNDGDECFFRLNEVVYVTGAPEGEEVVDYAASNSPYELEDSDCAFTEYDLEKGSEKREIVKSFEKLLSSMENQLKATFGDHVQVIVSPDKVIVNEYDHD